MKLVIDIPEEDYKRMKEQSMFGRADVWRKAIQNGQPLPDGAEILTKEAYSDLCKRAADVPETNVGELPSARLETHEKRTKTHACDCISREAAQKLICEDGTRLEKDGVYELTMCAVKQWAVDLLDELPSAEPERKPGKWIKVVNPDTNEWTGGFKCSECDRSCVQMSMDYCANCGAPMEVDG